MNCIYILRSDKNGRYYIGSTNDLERRLSEHNSGNTRSLKCLRPLRLVFNQEYEDIKMARKIELKLKKLKNRNIINKIITDGEIRLGP